MKPDLVKIADYAVSAVSLLLEVVNPSCCSARCCHPVKELANHNHVLFTHQLPAQWHSCKRAPSRRSMGKQPLRT